MGIVRVTIADEVKYLQGLASDFMPTVRRGLVAGAARCIPILQRRTREAPPANPKGIGSGGAVNTGGYLRRWRSMAIDDGAMVYNDHPAAAVVEKGRRPGTWVDREGLKALAGWARRRLQVSAKDALSVAYAIARSIHHRGLLPRSVMDGGMEELVRAVLAEVMEQLDAALNARR